MDLWYPGATRDLGESAGDFLAGHKHKGLFHTTEGKSYASARAAYASHRGWPHFTEAPDGLRQHLPINKAARALKNLAGGHETNRDGVIQIELVGTADYRNFSWGDLYVANFSFARLDRIRKLMLWLREQLGIQLHSNGITWKRYPDSYGDNGIRLSNTAWHNFDGWLGHQHAPENLHGDPGLLNIAYLIRKEDTFLMALTDAQQEELYRWAKGTNAETHFCKSLLEEYKFALGNDPIDLASTPDWIRNTRNQRLNLIKTAADPHIYVLKVADNGVVLVHVPNQETLALFGAKTQDAVVLADDSPVWQLPKVDYS